MVRGPGPSSKVSATSFLRPAPLVMRSFFFDRRAIARRSGVTTGVVRAGVVVVEPVTVADAKAVPLVAARESFTASGAIDGDSRSAQAAATSTTSAPMMASQMGGRRR